MDKQKDTVRLRVCPEFHKLIKKKSVEAGKPVIEYTRILTQKINEAEGNKEIIPTKKNEERKKGFYDYKIF